MIVVADRIGQLTNRLFQFAHVIAWASELGIQVANPGFRDYAADFPVFADDALCRWPRSRFRVTPRVGWKAFGLTRRLRDFAGRRGKPLGPLALLADDIDLAGGEATRLAERHRLLLVTGWGLRDDGALVRQAGLLREIFVPAGRHLAAAEAARSRAGSGAVVGLHIRRGDYEEWNEGRYYWSSAEYAEIAQRIRSLPSHPTVLACSDDPAVFDELGDLVVRGPGDAVADLWALSRCDAVVGPPSTFSGWAAFQGDVRLHYLGSPREPLDDLEPAARR